MKYTSKEEQCSHHSFPNGKNIAKHTANVNLARVRNKYNWGFFVHGDIQVKIFLERVKKLMIYNS